MRKFGKKLLAAVTASMMVLALAGCGGSDNGEKDTEAAKATEAVKDTAGDTAAEGAEGTENAGGAEASGSYNMTFIMPTRNEFNTAMEDGMKSYCDENGIGLTSQDANQDSSKLLQYVETAKNAGDDAVIILPIDSETIPQIVEAAGDMKVVIVNRAPADMSVFSGDVAYVGSNESDAGRFQGEYLVEVLKWRSSMSWRQNGSAPKP